MNRLRNWWRRVTRRAPLPPPPPEPTVATAPTPPPTVAPPAPKPPKPPRSLTNQVQAAEQRARRRMANLKQRRGVVLRGSQFDPTRGKDPSKMTPQQTAQYLRDLQAFNARPLNLVAGAGGRPIEKTTAERLEQARKNLQDQARQRYEQTKDIQLPSGSTVEDRAKFRALGRPGDTETDNPLGEPIGRLEGVYGEKAARTLADSLEHRATDEGREASVKSSKNSAAGMLDQLGRPDLVKVIRDMSASSWNLIWNDDRAYELLIDAYEADNETFVESMLERFEEVLAWGVERDQQNNR